MILLKFSELAQYFKVDLNFVRSFLSIFFKALFLGTFVRPQKSVLKNFWKNGRNRPCLVCMYYETTLKVESQNFLDPVLAKP